MKLYALHGMLGLPSDWHPFFPHAECPFLFEKRPLPFHKWATAFNESVDPSEDNILIGYSLGGRLALQALLHSPSLWCGAILISTGLKSQPGRLDDDRAWASKFETMPWEDLMKLWNGQKIFQHTFTPCRNEGDFNRSHLAGALLEWSIGLQGDLLNQLKHLSVPLLWIYGERDPNFLKIPPSPLSKMTLCPDAGHRLQWDNSSFFKQTANTFIKEITHASNCPLGTH